MQLKTLWLIGCLTLLPSMAKAGECLQLVMPGGDRIAEKTAAYATEMFYRFGVCTKITVVPPYRATKMMLAGKVDGEIARIADYAETVQHVAVKVPTPVVIQKACLVTGKASVQSLADIDQPWFTVGIVRGWLWMDKIAEQLKNAKIRVVEDQETLIEMFEKERLDAVVMNRNVINFHSMDSRFNTIHIKDFPEHIWLSKAKTHMVGQLNEAILAYAQKMGEDATDEALTEIRAK